VLIYEEKDKGFYVGVGQTQSSRFVTIEAHDHQTTEIYLIDADRPESDRGSRRASMATSTRSSTMAMRSSSPPTREARKTSASAMAPLVDPQRSNWREMIPHKPGRLSWRRSPSAATWSGSSARTVAPHRHPPFRRWCRARHRLR
jgi:oligopeptidase B